MKMLAILAFLALPCIAYTQGDSPASPPTMRYEDLTKREQRITGVVQVSPGHYQTLTLYAETIEARLTKTERELRKSRSCYRKIRKTLDTELPFYREALLRLEKKIDEITRRKK